MQYFGGKQRIAKDIISFLSLYRDNYRYFYEPFVGGCNIVQLMKGERFASDKNEYLIEMYLALQNGWVPPQKLTNEEYQHIKDNKDENKAMSGFAGFGCSFSGKWFGGFAKNKRGDNYAMATHNSLMKLKPLIADIKFKCLDYREAHPQNSLIYCDPPYNSTTKYDAIGEFDTNEFWDIMRMWSKNNRVFISEYNAPEDFECVWKQRNKLRD